MDKIEKIKKLATLFRLGIEQLKKNNQLDKFDPFLNFPKGCCGDASELLSKFLKENDIETKYITGEEGRQSHAWLEYDEFIIIDITADQFDTDKEKVVVTTDKNWHLRFQERKEDDLEIDERLLKLYKKIKFNIMAIK